MPKSVAFDPVCSLTGTSKKGVTTVAKTYTVAFDPICRLASGNKTAIVSLAN
jgi:hypothetical protein